MDKSLYIFLFLIFANTIQAQEYISNYPSFEKDRPISLFGDQVHLRSEASTESNSLAILEIGTEVTPLDDSNQNYSQDSPFWVYVKYLNQKGYIRSDFLSMQTVGLNGVPLYTQLDNNEDKTTLKIRIPTKGKPAYKEKSYEVFSSTMQLEVMGSKGLKNVLNMIHVNYFAEACGIDGGGKYIFIDASGNWYEAFTYTQIADADIYYWIEELTFPSEHNKGDYIIYTSEYLEPEFEGDDYINPIHTEEHKSERILKWNGSQIIPKFKQAPVPHEVW